MIDAAVAERVIEIMQIAPGDRILHIGCGDGALTRRLARLAAGGLAVGMDESDDAVREARKLSIDAENLMFALGSAAEIPWKEDFFPVLLCESGGAAANSAAEMARVLAPAGRAFAVNAGAGWAEALAAAGFDAVRAHQAGGLEVVEGRKPSHRDHRPVFAIE